MSTQNNIYPKACVYNCNTQIYWNTSENTYFEVFTKKKHICPNRVNKPSTVTSTNTTNSAGIPANTKPTYYSKKPWTPNQPKPKMSNSFELLTGPIETIQKNYEVLSDMVTEYSWNALELLKFVKRMNLRSSNLLRRNKSVNKNN